MIHTLTVYERKRAMRKLLLLLVFLAVGGNQEHKRSNPVESDLGKQGIKMFKRYYRLVLLVKFRFSIKNTCKMNE